MVSWMLMVWVQTSIAPLPEFPQASVAVQVLMKVPTTGQAEVSIKMLPSVKVMVAVPQPVIAVAIPVIAGSVGSPHSTVASRGQVIIGGGPSN